MKNYIILFSILFTSIICNAQKVLSKVEVNTIFNDDVKNLYNISYSIFKAYNYINNKQLHYLVLTETIDDTKGKDTTSKNVKAFIFKDVTGELKKEVEINDNINPSLNEEYSISFWTKYTSFEKVGTTTVPIIVYGTKGMNNYMDGRIKIIVIYNNQKIAIRHQNGLLDSERLTKIDKAFYSLPTTIQNAVKKKITAMEKADHAILGYGWEKEMKQKKLEIKG